MFRMFANLRSDAREAARRIPGETQRLQRPYTCACPKRPKPTPFRHVGCESGGCGMCRNPVASRSLEIARDRRGAGGAGPVRRGWSVLSLMPPRGIRRPATYDKAGSVGQGFLLVHAKARGHAGIEPRKGPIRGPLLPNPSRTRRGFRRCAPTKTASQWASINFPPIANIRHASESES
jgi:hypothetical protein